MKTGIAILNGMDVNQGSTGDCGLSMGVSPNVFNCNDIGDNNVILTIEDGNGNQSTCEANSHNCR